MPTDAPDLMRSSLNCPPPTQLPLITQRDRQAVSRRNRTKRHRPCLFLHAVFTRAFRLCGSLSEIRHNRTINSCRLLICLVTLASFSVSAHHDNSTRNSATAEGGRQSGEMVSGINDQSEFTFARLVYEGINSWSDWPRWQADWPEAEWHFSRALDRLTRIDTHQEGVLIRLDDDSVFDYPWLYAVEVGSLNLSSHELQTLREYLLRGGFLIVDDFHGIDQWHQFEYVMRQVFPDREIEEPINGVGVYSVLFDIGETQQIPGIRPWLSSRTWEYGGTVPRWRFIRDDDRRVMVAINFNMDLGDAWEHADDPQYPQSYSSLAYRIGTNYVLYSMTH